MYLFARLIAAASFLLVIAGGLVTSTDSGLAVPDWPLSFGTLFPPMVGGIRFEHSHRVLAATVGLLTLGLTLGLLFTEPRRWVRRLGLAAFALVVFQGILGGITVLMQLPHAVSIAHAASGQLFFATIVTLTATLSPSWKITSIKTGVSQAQRHLALLSSVMIFLQLIFGASLRHIGWLPHLLGIHVILALVLLGVILKTAGRILQDHRGTSFLTRPAQAMIWLFLLQLILGITTLVGGAEVWVATAHVAIGAALLAVSVLLTARLYKFRRPESLNLKIYRDLTKPRLTALAVVAAGIGFLMAPAQLSLFNLVITLVGTFLVGAGSGTLNQVLEKEPDSRMLRTQHRPIPSGKISVESATRFGVSLSVAGLLLLSLAGNLLAGALAAITLLLYLFVYTPMKQRSSLCTLVGAIPGALPPVIGWAVAQGQLGMGAWALFSILFLWQFPHFLAIAWEHREDYARAGFQMLPVVDPEGGLTFRQMVLYSAALVPASLLPYALGLAGWVYFCAALFGSIGFLSLSVKTARIRSDQAAHRFFLVSLLYLPFILTTMTLDRFVA